MLYAIIAFGLAVVGGTPAAIVAVLVGLAALAITLLRGTGQSGPADGSDSSRLLALGVILFGVVGTLGIPGLSLGPESALLDRLPGFLWILVGAAALIADRRDRDVGKPLIGIALAATAILGVLHIDTVRDIGLDVMVLHKQAAAAIANGENPYTDAVKVFNGAPDAAPDDVIVGYPYPPLTAVAFSLSEWAFDDARFTGLAAWLGFLSILGFSSLKRGRRDLVHLVLLMAALPGWPLVLRAAWTEPFSLLLLATMFVTWGRTRLSGTFLGLALASKQYFAVTAPVMLLARVPERWKRVVAASLAVVGVLAVGFAMGPAAFWSAGIEFHLSTPPRPESSNLVGLASLLGLSWTAPTVVTLGLGVAAAVVLGLRATDRSSFALALAGTLAASFFVSSQAFANYWFLIMGLIALSVVLTDQTDTHRA